MNSVPLITAMPVSNAQPAQGHQDAPPQAESSRSIPWKRRADLVVGERNVQRRVVILKDPLSLRYFELTEETLFLWEQLDGQLTLGNLHAAFQARFPGEIVSSQHLQLCIDQLVSQGLVVPTVPGFGRPVATRMAREQARQSWARWTNPLAIRFRGIDPDRLLDRLNVWIGWIFSPLAVAAGGVLIAAALLLVVVEFEVLVSRLPESHVLLSGRNLLWLPLLLAMVKVLHEIGHGLMCKRFGGECREMGVLLLLFTPTLYCNVSDAWMLRSKWQRIAVSAAGMWVELLIAGIATLLWWFSQPGLFHSLCLNLMLLCSLSTLMFNGNPLLRYDGYFVLADWIEISNLQQQSSSTIRQLLSQWFFGMPANAATTRVRRAGLTAYGISSAVYRVMLTLLMLWGLHRWWSPYGLGSLALAFAGLVLFTLVGSPVLTAARFVRDPAHRRHIRWPAFWGRGPLTLVVLAVLLFVPLPMRVAGSARLDDGDTQAVYVTVAGTLVDGVLPGASVEAGDVICRLEDPQLVRDLARLDGELELTRVRLENLERQRIDAPLLAESLPALREAVADLEAQREQRRQHAERLTLRSPCRGVVLPITRPEPTNSANSLSGWSGSPLDLRQRGCYLTEGTVLCRVGPRTSRSAEVVLAQSEGALVRVGQAVQLQWNELAGEVATGRITKIGSLDESPSDLAELMRLGLPVEAQSGQGPHLVGAWIRARVELDTAHALLPRGATGPAKVVVEPQSLMARLIHWGRQTFAVGGEWGS